MIEMQVERHPPIREQVAAKLRTAIVDMRLLPGQALIERELCEVTSASRPSVREALRQLEAEGLVEVRNGRGAFVTSISPETARELYQVRANLEGLAARLFVENASEMERAELRACFNRLVECAAGDSQPGAILAAKDKFYDVIFRGAKNDVLHQVVATLHHRVTQLRALTLGQPGRTQTSVNEIREILEAIEARSSTSASAAAVRHVEQAASIAGRLQNGNAGNAT